ncbi:MAG: hypothetical protein E4H02_10255 [Lentisphaerales bacterium]|jgi:hypothetical protein|nr:MAG: hypothetical protein E4H02_10255 [Lentisphaerales bacterium]
MSRLLSNKDEDDLTKRFGASSLRVRDTLHCNSAAKFWTALIDEIMEDYPGCDSLTLSAPGSDPITKELLYPQKAFERDSEELADVDLAEFFKQVTAELELYGPPSSVVISLFSGLEQIILQELPPESVDADIFMYLFGWLLEWSEIPEPMWNNEFLSGRIVGGDDARMLHYEAAIAFRNEHLSEGLYRRTVSLQFKRKQGQRKAETTA